VRSWPQGTFTHLACLKHFGESAEYVPQINLSGCSTRLTGTRPTSGWCRSRTAARDRQQHPRHVRRLQLLICGEILVEVAHDLMNVTGDIDHVKKVYSHPHAIASARLARTNLRESRLRRREHGARAELAADDPAAAAIAGAAAAKIYG